MLFTSPQFLLCLALLCGLNQLFGAQGRRWLLLLASLLFVLSFNALSLVVLLILCSVNFFVAQSLSKSNHKPLFISAIVMNVLAIVANNYIIAYHGTALLSLGSIEFRADAMLLLAGLSFYSLQHIAYLTDVWYKRLAPENNWFDFVLISAYVPKLLSGPLTLYQQLKPQLSSPKPGTVQLLKGFNRLLLGFFKKLVLADRLAPSVSSVFDYDDALPGITVFSAALLFTMQLYFDFSGYCDMAIGASNMLGIQLPENFDFPLRSASITVFWRRWHQTLIHFFTSYIFYPVSFRFRQLKKRAIAWGIVLTFLISGLWHGIGFTFMAWALCHLLYLLFELYARPNATSVQDKGWLKKIMPVAIVWILVTFSNIFFRAGSTSQALHLVSVLPHFFPDSWLVQFIAPLAVGGHQLEHFNLTITLLLVVITLVFERKIFAVLSSPQFMPLLTLLVLLLIFMFGVFNNGQRFIYMQF